MKNFKIAIKILILTCIFSKNMPTGFAGRTAEQASSDYTGAVRTGLTARYGIVQGNGQGGNCPVACPAGSHCSTSAGFIPSFGVYIMNKEQQVLNNPGKNLLPISANITSFTSNAILTVNIFAPSNIATSTPTFIDKNYTIFYTLKSPDGTSIYTDFEEFTSTSIPHYIAINPIGTPTGTSPAPATFPQPQAGTSYSFIGKFLPVTNFPTGQTAWQILNGISPISQSFLLSVDSNTPAQISITPISGIYDAGSFSSGSSPTSFNPSSGANGLGSLGIILDGQNTNITFAGTKVPFTTTDLENGLILNIVITSQQGNNNFNVAATIRTSDGTKMRKETLLSTASSPIASLPFSITIQQNSTTILTTNFLDSNIPGNTTCASMILPINLRFSISQPKGSPKIQVLMI
ncbi:hypothetical protein HYV10_03155 [Candidatus Dependentiae bacterium]|nr:hypothetical protein [Candidatus Dependentiae bacterium]